MIETLLTLEEVARLLKISTRTVRRLIETDKLNAFYVGGRLRFTPSQIESYIKCQQVQGAVK